MSNSNIQKGSKMSISGNTISMSKARYRKVYEKYIGIIPKEANGRTYEIHHIDGNKKNNDPSNLKAVTVQEHYDIHWEQGDYAACMYMALRMNKAPEEISGLARIRELDKVKKGIHRFQGGEIARKMNLERAANGTHPFQGGEISRKNNKERLENGTHNLLGPRTSDWCEWNIKMQAERVRKGTHNFLGITNQQIVHDCPICKRTGKGPRFKHHHFDNCKE